MTLWILFLMRGVQCWPSSLSLVAQVCSDHVAAGFISGQLLPLANIHPAAWDLDNPPKAKQPVSTRSEWNACEWVNQKFPDLDTTVPQTKFSWFITPSCCWIPTRWRQEVAHDRTGPSELNYLLSHQVSAIEPFLGGSSLQTQLGLQQALMSPVSEANKAIISGSGCRWTCKAAQTQPWHCIQPPWFPLYREAAMWPPYSNQLFFFFIKTNWF